MTISTGSVTGGSSQLSVTLERPSSGVSALHGERLLQPARVLPSAACRGMSESRAAARKSREEVLVQERQDLLQRDVAVEEDPAVRRVVVAARETSRSGLQGEGRDGGRVSAGVAGVWRVGEK